MMRKVRKQRHSNGPNDSARWSSGMWGGRPRPRGGPCLRLAQAGRGRSARSMGAVPRSGVSANG
jgi:hypothetical protein